VKRTRQIDGDDLVPLLDREILDLLDMLDAGIVDQDVDRRRRSCSAVRDQAAISAGLPCRPDGRAPLPSMADSSSLRIASISSGLSEAVDDDVVALAGKGAWRSPSRCRWWSR
jgi:hypothetical protein